MWKTRLIAFCLLVAGFAIGWFVYSTQKSGSWPFRLGLDLSGGTQLVYKANLSSIPPSDVKDSMQALRDTVERRVNIFGVTEPIVQTETGGALAGEPQQRLVVELPGVTDTQKAIAMIGQTPVLEFRLLKKDVVAPEEGKPVPNADALFEPASVTGKHVSRAELRFGNGSGSLANEPVVVLHFNSEGTKLFASLTRDNVGKVFGIFLDGIPISEPVIREAIPDGTAVISGTFTPDTARELVRNLNYGALPVPIELIGTETESSILGKEAITQDIKAGLMSIGAVVLFMLVWYRLPGLVAATALLIYVAVMLAIFKVLPSMTLSAAGIAGFILSVGMAVDANILIFERIKEERRGGKDMKEAIHDGFKRAWPSIRDSNISSMITAVILYWLGTAAPVKGFALVFGLGVLISMLTAISVSRTFLFALGLKGQDGLVRFLFGSGVNS